jgi:hypothetical protein
MEYPLIADILWYTGHILTGIAVFANHYHYPIAVSFVFTGQVMTIISRPIGRIQSPPPLPFTIRDIRVQQLQSI